MHAEFGEGSTVGSAFTVTVTVKASPSQPLAPVGVTVYTTIWSPPDTLVRTSVMVPAVEVPVVSPVTFGLSAADQLKVTPAMPLVISDCSTMLSGTSEQVIGSGSAPTGSDFTVISTSKVMPSQPSASEVGVTV